MKVLITGGAGFLGLHLAKYFSRKKSDIYLLDIVDFDKNEYPKKSHFIKAWRKSYHGQNKTLPVTKDAY